MPVDILIDNKSAKVDEGIILGGETGSTTGEVNLSSNAKAAKKIDGTNALNNNVELKDFTSYAMELSGIQDLSLKDNAYLSSGAPINISGRVDVQTGSTLALTSPLPNSVGILSGGGKVYIGEEVNATINTVDGADKPTIEFAETLDELNDRNAISPIITTSAENFEKLNLKLRGVDEPLKMENGTYTQSQSEQDNQRKAQAVQELYTEANNLKTAYDDAKTQAGPAISPDDANNINNAKAAYEAKYQEATDALNQLEENLKTQINTYGLSSPVDTATVNDIDGNSQIDDIEVNLINGLFQLAKYAKDSYNQAKDNLGATVDIQEAETINSKKSEYEAKYAEANVAFNNLSQMLQSRVNKQNLPTNLDEVIANDIDGNDQLDSEQTRVLQNLFDEAKTLFDKYNKAKSDTGEAYSQDDVDAINAAREAYSSKFIEALNLLDQLIIELRPSIDNHDSAPIMEDVPTVNDKNNNEIIDANESDENNDSDNGTVDNPSNNGGDNDGTDTGNNPGDDSSNAGNDKDNNGMNPGNVDNGNHGDEKVNPPDNKDDNASKNKSEKNSKVIKKESMSNQASPKTGDDSDVLMSISAMIGAIGALAFMRRKKESK